MTYNPRKASQIIAYFAMQTGENEINVLKAVKLVYLADRENISRSGFPILDERHVSMRHGPVNSLTYNHIKGEVHPDLDGGWSEFVEDRKGHFVGLKKHSTVEDDLDELSDDEVETLQIVWQEFGHFDEWNLVAYTHDANNIPEWEDPQGAGSKTISLKSIMSATGIIEAKQQADEVEGLVKASQLLRGL